MATKKKAARKTKKKAARKAPSVSNFERLDRAGVVRAAHVTDEHRKAIDRLSAGEVSALIAVKKKLAKHVGGALGDTAYGAGQPWIL